MNESDPRSRLPSVQHILEAIGPHAPRALAKRAARIAVDDARQAIEAGQQPSHDEVAKAAQDRLAELELSLLGPVVNATGVLLHTNLGRAPIGPKQQAAINDACGYANIEYRLSEGSRGSRHDHAGEMLAAAAGAEAGLVVNNNAAAVLLVLAATARGRDVIVSRGELVEIGGGFRVPEIMAETGARLVEVGTTNRTRLADYERAIRDRTALLLKVHASNYRMVGFVESTGIEQLATLGPPVAVDAGSGLLDRSTPWLAQPPEWLGDEPGVRQCIEQGAALVTFSGDKLLGGPQAGVIVGSRGAVEACAKHPLARALRADKLTIAGLESLALAYLDGEGSPVELWRRASQPIEALRVRAERIAAMVTEAKVVDTEAAMGGGSLPGLTIPSVGIEVRVSDADAVLAALRRTRVVARASDGAVVCDLRTVHDEQDDHLVSALRAAVAAGS